jgi:hypothetical protein
MQEKFFRTLYKPTEEKIILVQIALSKSLVLFNKQIANLIDRKVK